MSSVDSGLWRALAAPARPAEPPTGLELLLHRAHGAVKKRFLRTGTFMSRARAVLRLEQEFSTLADARLRSDAEQLRGLFCRGREKPADVLRACAVIREGAKRVFGFGHHAEQVAGALAMFHGCIAEMATGEGKTLTAVIPAILAGWRGRGCHVVTVNDYLAGRDCGEMGKLYRYFQLSSASIHQESKPPERRAAYHADITYLTNKEAAADYLRDCLELGGRRTLAGYLISDILGGNARSAAGVVQRGLAHAIVDEADSVLIDEAVTPLIISQDGDDVDRAQAIAVGRTIAQELEEGRDYRVLWTEKRIRMTPAGRRRLRDAALPHADEAGGGIWKGARRREEIVVQALNARHFFRKGAEYIVDDGKVVIVDEATGRLMPDRSWREGLHQAVEVKEGVEMTPPKETLARISFQRFFRLYGVLSGMTGTGLEGEAEFWNIYNLPVVRIPTHRKCLRVMSGMRAYATPEAKWEAVVGEIAAVHAGGRPVLVGTRSVGASELLSRLLEQAGLEHEVLNAVHHRREAEIVARAGTPGRITVATNMAGRGTDIKLTDEARELGGLHVIASERHLSRRVDRQLYGRSARQGDPGSAATFVSFEDELVRRFATRPARLLTRLVPFGPVGEWLRGRMFDQAAAKAAALAYRQRRGVMQSDSWLKEHLGFAGEDMV